MTRYMFEPSYLMVKCDPKFGKYMACSIMYKGDVVARDINAAIINLRTNKRIQFVDWCPSGFRVAMSQKMPTYVRGGDLIRVMRESVMIANTTAMNDRFSNLAHRFDLMYKKRAFMHWYLQEGMEEQKFVEAR
jgi:tubulin alpha